MLFLDYSIIELLNCLIIKSRMYTKLFIYLFNYMCKFVPINLLYIYIYREYNELYNRFVR